MHLHFNLNVHFNFNFNFNFNLDLHLDLNLPLDLTLDLDFNLHVNLDYQEQTTRDNTASSVTNLTSKPLTPIVQNILSLGFSFQPSPGVLSGRKLDQALMQWRTRLRSAWIRGRPWFPRRSPQPRRLVVHRHRVSQVGPPELEEFVKNVRSRLRALRTKKYKRRRNLSQNTLSSLQQMTNNTSTLCLQADKGQV